MIIENTGLNGMTSDLAHLDESGEKLEFSFAGNGNISVLHTI